MGFLKAVVLFLRGHFLGRHLDRRVPIGWYNCRMEFLGRTLALLGHPHFNAIS